MKLHRNSHPDPASYDAGTAYFDNLEDSEFGVLYTVLIASGLGILLRPRGIRDGRQEDGFTRVGLVHVHDTRSDEKKSDDDDDGRERKEGVFVPFSKAFKGLDDVSVEEMEKATARHVPWADVVIY